MPVTSTAQKKIMCIALSIKRNETPASYSKEAAKLAQSMSEEQLADYCNSKIMEG